MTTATMTDDLYRTRLTEAADPIAREHPTVWGTEADGPFDAEELRAHEERGFTILPDTLSGAAIETYSRELSRLTAAESLRGEVRSIFAAQQLSELIDDLSRDPRLLDRARQLLGSDVYLHQTRINYMPGFKGSGFYWHSDFETWHAEDGMPAPRAVSCSLALTPNYPYNGGLM